MPKQKLNLKDIVTNELGTIGVVTKIDTNADEDCQLEVTWVLNSDHSPKEQRVVSSHDLYGRFMSFQVTELDLVKVTEEVDHPLITEVMISCLTDEQRSEVVQLLEETEA